MNRQTYLEGVRATIDEHGWAVQGVFGDRHPFSYTVGLTEREAPELWIGTMPPEVATRILNRAARALTEGGVPLVDGGEVDIEYSVPFRLRGPVDPEAAEANIALEMFPVVRVWQLLWPDDAGRFPDDEDYAAKLFPQRLLERAS